MLMLTAAPAHGSPQTQEAPQKVPPQQAKKPFMILPLVTFFNGVKGEVYNWWAEDESGAEMAQLSKKVWTLLANDKENPWRYSPTPAESLDRIPQEFRQTALSAEQKIKLAEVLGARIIITGDFYFTKSVLLHDGYLLRVRLEALRASNGAPLAEVLRFFDVSASEFDQLFLGVSENMATVALTGFRDLHAQIIARAAAETPPNSIQLMISGNLNFAQLELLKQKIQQSVKGVQGFRQTAVENEQIAFSVDYGGKSTAELSRALSQVQFPQFMTQVVSADAGQVLFDVKARAK